MGTMQAPEAYVAELLAALEPLPAVVLPLAEAHGLILAEDAAAARAPVDELGHGRLRGARG